MVDDPEELPLMEALEAENAEPETTLLDAALNIPEEEEDDFGDIDDPMAELYKRAEEDEREIKEAAREAETQDLDERVTILEMSQRVPDVSSDDVVQFGKPVGAYTSGATIALTDCDVNGVATGDGTVTVQAGWTLPTVTGTALNIPTSAIIPFKKAIDGLYYVVGRPVQAWGQVTYNTTTHKLQQTTWYEFGLFRTTISDAQDITTAVDCTAV